MIRVFIEEPDYGMSLSVWIMQIQEGKEESHSLQPNKKGELNWKVTKANKLSNIPPIFEFKSQFNREILQQLSEALAKNGYFPKEFHRDKIKAEVIVDEKVKQIENNKEQIGWLRDMIQQHWHLEKKKGEEK